jgi:hypothetical protein
MAANIHQEVNQIVEIKSRATWLDNLIQGYRLCARTEGKSENTIRIYTTALTALSDFLKARQYPADVTEIGAQELREFILHLQQVRAFEHHPFNKPRDKGLSGYAVNCYLRAVRAFLVLVFREVPPQQFIKRFEPFQFDFISPCRVKGREFCQQHSVPGRLEWNFI